MSGPAKQLDTLRNTLRNRAVDLQNRLEDNQGRYNYQSCADAEAVLIVLADITHTPEAPSLLQDTEFMENEFLPRRRSAEAVFNALSLEMPRSHGEVQSFVRRYRDISENRRSYRVGHFQFSSQVGREWSFFAEASPWGILHSHAPASVRVSSGDVEMAETAPTPPPKTSEGKGTPEGSSATKSSKKKKGKKKEEPIPISDDEAPVITQRASRPRTPHQLVTLLSFLTFVWSQLKPLLRLLQKTTISTAELVDQAQKTVSAGQELSRKRARADSEEAATTVRQVQALRDQYRLINPGAVQGILPREYQEALLPSATVEMVIIPEGAPLPHDPRAASWGFIDWNEAFRAAYHSRDDCPRRGTAGTNGTSGGNVEASVAATPTGNNTSAESSQVQDQDNSVDDSVSEGPSQTQQD
ncbi:hypothetical protein K435DRAFT_802428 [Dendrothele bispora CBS 962.96]|uniref:Uncharacterized protein n=1 Tax=Dendrothele bispora (strain CBS 962.96) TaxID=1314807 RepID=A0A4S8LLB9_DENBC|nr:hypothetical protein K435DRAFT_802428 [Dendrothele bispora CBS 962.96]